MQARDGYVAALRFPQRTVRWERMNGSNFYETIHRDLILGCYMYLVFYSIHSSIRSVCDVCVTGVINL